MMPAAASSTTASATCATTSVPRTACRPREAVIPRAFSLSVETSTPLRQSGISPKIVPVPSEMIAAKKMLLHPR